MPMAKPEIRQISPSGREGDVSRVENAHLSWMSQDIFKARSQIDLPP